MLHNDIVMSLVQNDTCTVPVNNHCVIFMGKTAKYWSRTIVFRDIAHPNAVRRSPFTLAVGSRRRSTCSWILRRTTNIVKRKLRAVYAINSVTRDVAKFYNTQSHEERYKCAYKTEFYVFWIDIVKIRVMMHGVYERECLHWKLGCTAALWHCNNFSAVLNRLIDAQNSEHSRQKLRKCG